jgi:hypothetical protein
MCLYCLHYGTHKGHDSDLAVNVVAEVKQAISKAIEQLHVRESILTEQSTQVVQCTSKVNRSYDDSNAAIDQFESDAIAQIRERALKLKADLTAQRDTKLAEYTGKRQNIVDGLSAVKSNLTHYKQTLQNDTDLFNILAWKNGNMTQTHIHTYTHRYTHTYTHTHTHTHTRTHTLSSRSNDCIKSKVERSAI